jgi:hypothetical protein
MCGTSGLNAVERFIVGSVSEAIVRHAPCDVLVEVPHIIKSTPNSLANFLGIIALGEPNSKRVSTLVTPLLKQLSLKN